MKRILLTIGFALLLFGNAGAQTVTSTAGGLQAAVKAVQPNLAQVTNLTVNGVIDATDFRFMRDSLNTTLQTLDLSGCTIAAYSGTGGTNINVMALGKSNADFQTDYAANEVPAYALFYRYNAGSMFFADWKEFPMAALTTVKLPTSVTAIRDYAMANMPTLTDVNFSNLTQLLSIGDYAFIKAGFTTVNIPEGVTTIGSMSGYVFTNCVKLTSFTFPTSITSIKGSTFFMGDTLLQSVTFTEPASIATFPYRLFYSDPSTPSSQLPHLMSVTVPSSVTDVSTAFENFIGTAINCHPDNPVYYSDNGVLYKKPAPNGQFVALPKGITSFTIPASMTDIPNNMFQYCSKLTSVTVNSQLTSIGDNAFANSGITSFNFPSSLTQIGSYAFYQTQLSNISFSDNANLKSMGSYVFSNIPTLTSADLSGLDTLGTSMFASNNNFKNVTLSPNLKTISQGVFSGCSSMETVNIPNNVTAIGSYAFESCTKLANINMPTNLVSLGTSVFPNDTLITVINLPASFQTMAVSYGTPFTNSYAQITVDVANPYFAAENGILFNKDKNKVLYIPSSRTPQGVVLPNGVDSIANSAFYANLNNHITKLTLPASLKWIDGYGLNAAGTLQTIVCNAVVPPVCANASSSLNNSYSTPSSGFKVMIPPNTKAAYIAANGWKNWYNNPYGGNKDFYEEMNQFTNLGSGYTMKLSPNGRYVVGTRGSNGYLFDLSAGNEIPLPNNPSQAVDVNDKGMVAGFFADNNYMVRDPNTGEVVPLQNGGVYRDGRWYSLGLGRYGSTTQSSEIYSSIYAIDSVGNAYGMSNDKGSMTPVLPFAWKYNAEKDDYKTDTLAFSTPYIAGDQGARINDVSSDGTVACGWVSRNSKGGTWNPIIWSGSPTNYKVVENTNFSMANGVSPNGRYVALDVEKQAAIYDTQNDSMIVFGVQNSTTVGVSDNGFAVGYINQTGGRQAFIWSDKLGFMVFRDFLDKYCSNMEMPIDPLYPNIFDFPKEGGVFDVPMSISADGLVIAGWSGYTDMVRNSWAIQLAHPLDLIDRPRNLTATVDVPSRNKVDLAWNTPADYGTHTLDFYRVYRDGAIVADLLDATTLTSYTDTNVPVGNHTYTVSALFDYSYNSETQTAYFTESGVTNAAVITIVDNYNLPYYDSFEYMAFESNYWTRQDIIPSVTAGWGITYWMRSGYDGGAQAYFVNSGIQQPYNVAIVTKPLDASGKSTVILSYLYSLLSTQPVFAGNKDTVNVEIGVNGVWTNVRQLVVNQQVNVWTPVSIDISNVAAGKLFQVRFRAASAASQGDRTSFTYNLDELGVAVEKTPAPAAIMSVRVGSETQNRVYYKDAAGSYSQSYCNGVLGTSVGNGGIPFIVAQKFEANDMVALTGKYLTSITAFINGDNPEVTVTPTRLSLAVFKNGQRIVNEPVTASLANGWHNFKLSTPLLTDGSSLTIGLEVTQHDFNNSPVVMDTGSDSTFVNSKLLSYDDGITWSSASLENNPTFGYSFNGAWIIIPNYRDENVAADQDDDFYAVGYNIYKNGTLIATLHYGQTYIDTTGVASDCYTVSEFRALGGMSDQSEKSCVQLLGIQNVKTSTFNVYPNPSDTYVNVDGDFSLIKIYDSQGKFITQTKEKRIDVSGFAKGIYLFDATLANGQRAVTTVIVK